MMFENSLLISAMLSKTDMKVILYILSNQITSYSFILGTVLLDEEV